MTTNKKKNKLNATKVEIDGILFHSKFEGETYQALKNIAKMGDIAELKLQHELVLIPSFTFQGRRVRPTKMLVDFNFILKLPNGTNVEIDFETKGYKTDVYRIKVKLLKFLKKEVSKAKLYRYVLYQGKFLDSVYAQELKVRARLDEVINILTTEKT